MRRGRVQRPEAAVTLHGAPHGPRPHVARVSLTEGVPPDQPAAFAGVAVVDRRRHHGDPLRARPRDDTPAHQRLPLSEGHTHRRFLRDPALRQHRADLVLRRQHVLAVQNRLDLRPAQPARRRVPRRLPKPVKARLKRRITPTTGLVGDLPRRQAPPLELSRRDRHQREPEASLRVRHPVMGAQPPHARMQLIPSHRPSPLERQALIDRHADQQFPVGDRRRQHPPQPKRPLDPDHRPRLLVQREALRSQVPHDPPRGREVLMASQMALQHRPDRSRPTRVRGHADRRAHILA